MYSKIIMPYIHTKNGPVIKGLNMDLIKIVEIAVKIKDGVTYRRICKEYNISYYYAKMIEKKFG
jgi:hypothetical protein